MIRAVFVIVVASLLSACGPQVSKRTRYEWKAYSANEYSQTKDGIVVEYKDVKELPPAFYAEARACSKSGTPLADRKGNPVTVRTSFARPGQFWMKVAISNNTGHIIRLTRSVTRFFDPQGNQYDPLSKEDLVGEFLTDAGNCPSVAQLAPRFKLIKVLTRNTEILPNSRVTGWVAFRPASLQVPGMWKLSMFEIPTKTDAAGTVSKTANFDIRMNLKKFIDTYRKDDMFSEARLVSSKAVSD